MDEQVMALIEHLGATDSAELVDVCEGFLEKIPTVVIYSRSCDSLSGAVEILAPIDMRMSLNVHRIVAMFYFGPNNMAEVKLNNKVIKNGAWFEVVEFILCEIKRLRSHEDHL